MWTIRTKNYPIKRMDWWSIDLHVTFKSRRQLWSKRYYNKQKSLVKHGVFKSDPVFSYLSVTGSGLQLI